MGCETAKIPLPSPRTGGAGSGWARNFVPSCFPNVLSGCSICLVDDEVNIDRIRRQWDRADGILCVQRERTDLDDMVEDESEDTTSAGDTTERTEEEDSVQKRPSATSDGKATGGPRCGLQREVEALLWSASDAFAARGWSVVHVEDDCYVIEQRGVRLTLLPARASAPCFAHLVASFGREVAERGARLTVKDGPLAQPLLDYLLQTGLNESYDQRGTENPGGVTGAAKFLDFVAAPTGPAPAVLDLDIDEGDRLASMKQATMEAEVRRRAGSADALRTRRVVQRVDGEPQASAKTVNGLGLRPVNVPGICDSPIVMRQGMPMAVSVVPVAMPGRTAKPTRQGMPIAMSVGPVLTQKWR